MMLPERGYAKVREGDLLVSRTGTLGLTVPIRKNLENSVFGSFLIRIRPKTRINTDYLALFLNSYFGKIQVRQTHTGALQTNLTIPIIENLKVVVPSQDYQDEIGNLISKSRESVAQGKKAMTDAKLQIEKRLIADIGEDPTIAFNSIYDFRKVGLSHES